MAAAVKIRIGTRGSPLALAQAHAVRDALCRTHGIATDAVDIHVIKTTGDQVQDRKLLEIGGKGLFTKEIEVALAAKEIDLAVHSAKDMPTILPDGLFIAACLKREDPRDALICRTAKSLDDLPQGATLGTASLRREAQVRLLRPAIKVQPLRGNVETRLRRVRDGDFDATILGTAGLRRLGMTQEVTELLATDRFLPAVGQGTVAIEARESDTATLDLLTRVSDKDTATALAAERAFLRVLDGSCRTPIAGFAEVAGGSLHFRGLALRPDGSESRSVVRKGEAIQAASIGAAAGAELKAKLPPDFLTART